MHAVHWLFITANLFFQTIFLKKCKIFLQLPAMDLSAQLSMKDAAKCDRRCEWQNSANQENAERILRLSVTPEGMPSSGRLFYYAFRNANDLTGTAIWNAFMCVSDVFFKNPLTH